MTRFLLSRTRFQYPKMIAKRFTMTVVLVIALGTLLPDLAVSRGTGAVHRTRALLIFVRRRRRAKTIHTAPSLENFVYPPGYSVCDD